ncbi:MAG: ankyrin repeat domain-containing protein [Alphaproteobacteria bacterium]|nr:ankyrin repeat domain-containing protein [Alphaproteobacteria bacterium]
MNGVIRNIKMVMLVGTFLSAPAAYAQTDLPPLPPLPTKEEMKNAVSEGVDEGMMSLENIQFDDEPDDAPASADEAALQAEIAADMAEESAFDAEMAAEEAEAAANAAQESADTANDDIQLITAPCDEDEEDKAVSFEDEGLDLSEPSILPLTEDGAENTTSSAQAPEEAVDDAEDLTLSPAEADDEIDMEMPPLPGENAATTNENAAAAQQAEEELGAPPPLALESEEVFDLFAPSRPAVVAPTLTQPQPQPTPSNGQKQTEKPKVVKKKEPLVKLPKEYRLPAKIYKKEYSRDNGHLPEARYEHEYDAQLFLAAGNDRVQVVRALLDTGRSIEMRNAEGDTPLVYAVRARGVNVMRMLLGRGANPNATNDRGITPLHYAIIANSPIMADALLEMGADPNMPDVNGVTPLMLASNKNDAAFTQSLIERGSAVNLPSADGRTPLHVAAQTNNAKSLAILVKAGGDINARNVNGLTPLMVAAISGAESSTNVLLNAGADIYAADSLGRTALDLARGRDHKAVANSIMTYIVQQDRAAAQMMQTDVAPEIVPVTVTPAM